MGPSTAIQTSFAGGELDVGLRNRLDWQKRDSGAEEIANGLVLPTGGVVKRGGLRFVREALHHDKPATLVEFEFSADQIYMLEFGDNVMRFYWDGGLILNPDGGEYRVATPYTAEQAAKFRYVQDRDAMFFAHMDVTPQRLVRHGHTDWRWSDMFADAGRIGQVHGLDWQDAAANGHNNVEYAVTAYRTVDGARQESIGYPTVQAGPPTGEPIRNGPQKTIESCVNWINAYKPGFGHMPGFPAAPETFEGLSEIMEDGTSQEYGSRLHPKLEAIYKAAYPGMSYGYRLYVQNRNPITEKWYDVFHWELRDESGRWMKVWAYAHTNGGSFNINADPPVLGKVGGYYHTWFMRDQALELINSGAVSIDGQSLDSVHAAITAFIDAHNTSNSVRAVNRIKWRPTPDAEGYYVYRRDMASDDPKFYLMGDVTGTSYEDDLADEENIPAAQTPVDRSNSFTDPLDFPAVVFLFQQRLVFAQTRRSPSSIFGSHSGIYTDFSINPSDDSAGFEFRLSSQQLNAVEDLIALRRLIALTSGSEFINDISGPMASRNVNMVQQSSTGASGIPALVVDDMIVRVPRDRRSLSSMEYSLQKEGFVGNDLLYFARHLVADRRIVDIAYQRRPRQIIWVVLDDGEFIACTFIPEQSFLAWTRQRTAGKVVSLTAVNDNLGGDQLWAVVRRTLPDGTSRQYIERLEDPLPHAPGADNAADAFYVDSGLSMDAFEPQTGAAGLEHLEGMEVAILADGNVMPPRKVANGAVAFDHPVKKAHIGLPYEFRLKTLDLELSGQGTLRDARRLPERATVELHVARELNYRVNGGTDKRIEIQRGAELGAVPKIMNGDRKLEFVAGDSHGTRFEFWSDNPVPCGILSLLAEVRRGGNS